MGIRFLRFALLFLFAASATFAQSSRTRFGGGITVQTGDVDRSIPNNASTGTVLHRAVCYDTASPPLAIVCPTSTIGGVAGVADDGAGTTGSVQVGMLGQVLAEFDGNATAKNWAINSPTTVGRFHDTGSTTEPTGQQAFYIYTSQSGGAGGMAYIGILNPDVTSGGANGKGRGFTAADFPDVKIIPAANCPNATAGSGWSYATSTFTAACRAGTNNLGGALQIIPSTGGSAQFLIELPGDWDTATQPYINIYYGSGSNTSGTVIATVSSGCVDVSTPGGASDDPSFHAESAFATQTMASANKMWYIGGQFTAVTSGNGCKVFSPIIIKVAISGTAASNINIYKAIVTSPRAPKVQAN